MSFPTEFASRRAPERWRWVLYVALAIAGALLTFAGARAQQKMSEHATFQKLINEYCAAWSTANPDNAARFYAKDADLIFYDLAPFSYHGWKEYNEGVRKEFFNENFVSAKLTAGDDLKVTRRGTIAWTTVSMHLSEKTKDGKDTELNVRYTGIWERRGNAWVIVHEHLSVPLS